MTRDDLRNVAIVAHVDHGKTTLVDGLLRQSGQFHEKQEVADRAMDSNDQERERGITILAKCTSVRFGDVTLQIVDTPGHADFGGEVERTLQMVDGILLLVDAAEGPLPQTRFVLRKSLERGLPCVVLINKVDRSDARAQDVLNEIYDLFIDLGADDTQLEFPVLYAIAREGKAGFAPDDLRADLSGLVDTLIKSIPAPPDKTQEPFCLQVNQLAYDDYVGRLVVGRILAGTLKVNDPILVQAPGMPPQRIRVTGMFQFQGLKRLPINDARCGDIVAVAGISDVRIGDTLTHPDHPQALPVIAVDEPTVAMTFQINDSPWAGRSGGKFVTSRHLKARLEREAFANVSIEVETLPSSDQFRVKGRGELQLAVLIETLRREGYELAVRNPEVITREGPHGKEEPVERLVVDVPAEQVGAVAALVGERKAQLTDQKQEGDVVRMEYIIPTRGLFGLRSRMLTATRGTAVMHSVFEGWVPWSGPLGQRRQGALVADREGQTTPYAIFHLEDRGEFFVPPGARVYKGMIVGEHARDNNLWVNVVREKKLTNVRAAGKDESTACAPPRDMSLERWLEWIRDDELVEVTPEGIRARALSQTQKASST